jgi:hypothetical protein
VNWTTDVSVSTSQAAVTLDEAAVAAVLGGEAVEVRPEELAEAVAAVIAAEEGLGSPASKVVRRSSSYVFDVPKIAPA